MRGQLKCVNTECEKSAGAPNGEISIPATDWIASRPPWVTESHRFGRDSEDGRWKNYWKKIFLSYFGGSSRRHERTYITKLELRLCTFVIFLLLPWHSLSINLLNFAPWMCTDNWRKLPVSLWALMCQLTGAQPPYMPTDRNMRPIDTTHLWKQYAHPAT